MVKVCHPWSSKLSNSDAGLVRARLMYIPHHHDYEDTTTHGMRGQDQYDKRISSMGQAYLVQELDFRAQRLLLLFHSHLKHRLQLRYNLLVVLLLCLPSTNRAGSTTSNGRPSAFRPHQTPVTRLHAYKQISRRMCPLPRRAGDKNLHCTE